MIQCKIFHYSPKYCLFEIDKKHHVLYYKYRKYIQFSQFSYWLLLNITRRVLSL